MRAVVQEGYGSLDALKLRDIERPAIGDDGILVRVRAASLNAMDAHMVHMSAAFGVIAGLRRRNRVRGVDLAGEVVSAGKNVSRLKPGDAVFGVGRGSCAEFTATTEDRLAHKPASVSFQSAACLPVAGLSALQALRDKAQLRAGQRVLIHGAGGGVGAFAVQIAKALGAHVTAVTSTRNLAVVSALVPDEIVDYMKEDFTRRGARYDVILDIAATRPIGECLRALMPTGTLVLVGAPKSGGMMKVLGSLLSSRARSAVSKQRVVPLLAKIRTQDLAYLAELTAAGKVTPVIERQYGLPEAVEAIRSMEFGQASGKVVINVA